MAKNEQKKLEKTNWVSRFALIGRVKINEFTFKIDELSEKSQWRYNSLNLGVDCGEKYGTVFCEMMGGYSEATNNNVIYVHGKDGKLDDFSDTFTVDWKDRFNEDILETVGDLCFIKVGLERKSGTNDTFYLRFLSAYDAIAYIQKHLEDGMTVNVKGILKYSEYGGVVKCQKIITSIVLSKMEPDKFAARFKQSILINKDSVSLKDIDKTTGEVVINAKVLDYAKSINGIEIKGQYPYDTHFTFIFKDLKNGNLCKKIYELLFKVKKGYTQINFAGIFVETGAIVLPTYDDLNDDIKALVECGVYSKEEAIIACASNGKRQQKMIITNPLSPDGIMQKYEEQYSDDDFVFTPAADGSDELSEEDFFDDDNSSSDDNSLDWMKEIEG